MATWTFSGYNNGRGAAVTFTYTAAFDPATNKTRVTITNYTAVFNTGGATGYCQLTGTLTVKAADNTGSYGTLDVSASKSNANSPTVSTDVSQVIEVSHGKGTSKQITLAFSGTINSVTYFTYPEESSTVTVASATARSLSLSAGFAPAGPIRLTKGVHYFDSEAELPETLEEGRVYFLAVE